MHGGHRVVNRIQARMLFHTATARVGPPTALASVASTCTEHRVEIVAVGHSTVLKVIVSVLREGTGSYSIGVALQVQIS